MMLSKAYPRLRTTLRQFLGPVSSPLSRALKTTETISQNPRHVLKLLLNSRLAPPTQLQPDVYPFAAYLGERFGCTHLIAIGQPSPKELIQIYPKLEFVGIVPSLDVELCRKRYGFGSWLDENTSLAGTLPVPKEVVQRAVIVSKDVDQFADPQSLLKNVKVWLEHAPVCILTSTDRDLTTAGRPGKWNSKEFEDLLRAEGFNLEFIGWTADDNVSYEKKTIAAVITSDTNSKQLRVAPLDFRVVAFMAAYNEEDIIVQSIKKWTDQGVSVRVLENWSTDSTYDLAKELEGQLPVIVERFPKEGPSEFFDWGAMLERMETLAREIEADWFVRRGADEVLTSPWPGVSYRDALYLVDQSGFNCVDHTIVEFHPVDDGFKTGMDHEAYFRHFDLKNLSHANQRKAWKNCGQPISTIASAGHDVVFEGRRVYPFKFLIKHYSFRSQEHGEKKVFRERKARWNPKERARGWHIHYDSMQEGHRFVQSPSEKDVFDEDHFNKIYLVERLSGIGTHRKVFN